MSDKDEIANHYNEMKGIDISKRSSSSIINIRNFNNFIKSVLIRKYTHPDSSVLDLGCGRGGDLKKYHNSKIAYYHGLDIAENSIKEAMTRARSFYPCFKYKLEVQDTYNESFNLSHEFDSISCQFSLHYAFKTPESFKTTISNISKHLKYGGFFVATIPNSNTLLRRYQKYGNDFGNQYYKVHFKDDIKDICKKENSFGIEYNFLLDEAINDCKEYLVSTECLKYELEKNDIHIYRENDFLSFYNNVQNDFLDLHSLMIKERLSLEEQKVIEIYSVVVFRKGKL